MAMFVTTVGNRIHYQWHVGEPIPVTDARVVTFQADGDELEMIYQAMRDTHKILCAHCNIIRVSNAGEICKECMLTENGEDAAFILLVLDQEPRTNDPDVLAWRAILASIRRFFRGR